MVGLLVAGAVSLIISVAVIFLTGWRPGWRFFFPLGCASLVMLVWGGLLPEWRANNRYLPNSCVVLDRRLASERFDDPDGGAREGYHPEIKIHYQVDGRKYEVWTYDALRWFSSDRAAQQAIVDSFQVGATYPCWYDPDRPEKAILVRGHAWGLYVLLIGNIGFLLIGGLAIRQENRARLAGRLTTRIAPQRGLERTLRAGGAMAEADLNRQTVPAFDLSQRPGSILPYRLPGSTRPGRNLLGRLLLTLFWNGITAPFVVMVLAIHLGWGGMEGIAKWLITFVILPFVLVGLFLIGRLVVIAVNELLVALGIGPTTVEISAHPLVPGERCEVLLAQSWRRKLRMNSVEVLCICEEEASGGRGKNRRTAIRRVFEEAIIARETFDVQPGRPLEVRGELWLPTGAMHSFLALHNRVRWTLVVRGDVAGWPNLERSFPIVLQPSKGALR
jgi:hypothetical protein